jgi:hypothetical protein
LPQILGGAIVRITTDRLDGAMWRLGEAGPALVLRYLLWSGSINS